VETLWPPAQERRRAEERRLRLERETALSLHVVQFLKGGEMAIQQRGETPTPLHGQRGGKRWCGAGRRLRKNALSYGGIL